MFAAYIRVSTHEQNLDAQRAEITRWLEAHGHAPDQVRWFEDKQTGKNLKRPGFEQLQRAVFAGDVETVVVWKIDRLARSFRDGVKVVTDWIEQDVRLVSVTQAIDLSGVFGQALVGVLFAFAEMELSMIKERQAAGIAVAKKKGIYQGRKAGTSKAQPERARELRSQGLKIKEVAAAMGISERTVQNYLRA